MLDRARFCRGSATDKASDAQRPLLMCDDASPFYGSIVQWPGCPLTPERHCHFVGAGLGTSVTHLVHEASPAGDACGISIAARVGNCRDHISITVDVDVG